VGGVEAAKELARERRGGHFDPALSDLLDAEADVLLSGLESVGVWDAVIDAEPALAVVLSGEQADAALAAIANFVDLKSPYFLGHAGRRFALARRTKRLTLSIRPGSGRLRLPFTLTGGGGRLRAVYVAQR
jgi:hypothetical protein